MKLLRSAILLLGIVSICHETKAASYRYDFLSSLNRMPMTRLGLVQPTRCGRLNIQDCQDAGGLNFIIQSKQLRSDRIQEQGELQSNLQRTWDTIRASQEALDKIKDSGRRDLNAQIDRTESELLILRQIIEQQEQQLRSGLIEEASQQEQERIIQLTRMRNELASLLTMAEGMARFSTEEIMKDQIQILQEGQAIIELIKKELAEQGILGKLKPELSRLEDELRACVLSKAQVSRDLQQGGGRIDEESIQIRRRRTQSALINLVRNWAQLNMGSKDIRNGLDNILEQLERRTRVQSPRVRDQLSRAQNELEILSEMKSRAQQGSVRKQEIRTQREEVEDQLQTLVEMWTGRDGMQPIPRIICLVKEQISRLVPLQTSEMFSKLKQIQGNLQIRDCNGNQKNQQNWQDQDDNEDKRDRIEEELRTLLRMLIQGLRQAGRSGQIEQEVLGMLQEAKRIAIQETLQAGQKRQSPDQIDDQLTADSGFIESALDILILLEVNPKLRLQVNRVQNELQTLSQIRSRQDRLREQGDLSPAQRQQMQMELRGQIARLEKEMRALAQRNLDILKDSSDDDLDTARTQLPILELRKLKKQVGRALQSIMGLLQGKLQQGQRQQQQWKQQQPWQQQQQQQWQDEKRRQVEDDVKTLMQMMSLTMEDIDDEVLDNELSRLLSQVWAQIQIQGQTKIPRLGAELSRVVLEKNQSGRIPKQLLESQQQALLQILGQGLRQDEALDQMEQEIQAILGLEKDLIRKEGSGNNLEIRAQLNSVNEELRLLAQINARQIRQALEGSPSLLDLESQRQEIGMQLDRVKKSAMTLLLMLTKRGEQAGQGDRWEREIQAVLDLIRTRQGSLESSELKTQLRRIEGKLQILLQNQDDQSQGRIRQSLADNQQQRNEIEREMKILLQMIAREIRQDSQIRQEARVLMQTPESRQDSQLSRILSRVRAQLWERGLLNQAGQQQLEQGQQMQTMAGMSLQQVPQSIQDYQTLLNQQLETQRLSNVDRSDGDEQINMRIEGSLFETKAKQAGQDGDESSQEQEQEQDSEEDSQQYRQDRRQSGQQDRQDRQDRRQDDQQDRQGRLQDDRLQDDQQEGQDRLDRFQDEREDRIQDGRQNRRQNQRQDRDERRYDRSEGLRGGRRDDRRQNSRNDRRQDRRQDRSYDSREDLRDDRRDDSQIYRK